MRSLLFISACRLHDQVKYQDRTSNTFKYERNDNFSRNKDKMSNIHGFTDYTEVEKYLTTLILLWAKWNNYSNIYIYVSGVLKQKWIGWVSNDLIVSNPRKERFYINWQW